MICPPEGLCLRCTWVKNRDGDTVEVRLRSSQVVAVRLMECWAIEMDKEGGLDAKEWLDSLLADTGRTLRIWIPPAKDHDGDGVVDIKEVLRDVSFDRVVGRLFYGSDDVSELMVKAGYATAKKPAT